MKQKDYDTIFASSSQYKSANKTIRITGKRAKDLPKILNLKTRAKGFSLRKLIHKNKFIDYAPVVRLPKNNSFTGEDTLKFIFMEVL